ncbi:PH domain-containing protein [Litorihabitans aurantiacus]|uniref:Membrane protein n=1 Tax=Litorihabitans aurantiacus TaxID=1930061 RepID=A0AA37XFP2_9MICO|nr:PH domain-containing protein [Litorihabitans aurantiacus]GMA32445.1 membrane protein [Litorihabitans aurantiacus]
MTAQQLDPFEPDGVTWSRVSDRLVRARLVTAAIWLGLPVAGGVVLGAFVGGWTWIVPAVPAILLIWTLWLVPRQVRAIGYAEREDDLLVRKGVVFRKLVVVPYGRMQYTDVSSGPLTRSLGIAEVKLHTASASTDATIPGLPTAEAARVKDRLTSLGESRLAGL